MAAEDQRERATADTVAADSLDPRYTGERPIGDPLGSTTEQLAGRYRIEALVGSGGMGSVYRARDLELDEIVALKMLRRELLESSEAIEAFRREVKLARRVTHKNVARTFDIGEHGRDKFLTMELVEGESLAREMERSGTLLQARVIDVLTEVCAGLAAAHEAGVVHRDLKPENVLLARDGRVVVTDFGIACAGAETSGERSRGLVGTPAYMAPEQVKGRNVDARADVFALGVMAFEMLTGRLPWNGEGPLGLAVARLDTPAPDVRGLRSSISPAVATVVARCLERDPALRFQSAAEAREALLLARDDARATPSAMPSHAPPTGRSWVASLGTTPAAAKTLAVLPFRVDGAAEDADIVAGFNDDLVDMLSITGGLRVLSRATVAPYAKSARDPREIGRELGVQVVVVGSARRSGDRVRIGARLVTVEDGFQIWAKRFDTTPADLLVVSDQMARAIAEALASAVPAPERVAPADGAAVELYLRARASLRSFWREDLERAASLLEEALSLAPDDPTFLVAYARCCARVLFHGGDAAREYGRRARMAADRAMQVADHLGESWYAVASVRLNERDHAGAVTALRQALVRSPRLADAHEMLGRILLEAGEPALAIARLETAWSMEPTNLLPRTELARAHAFLGAWDEVERWLSPPDNESAMTWYTIVVARLSLWHPNGRVLVDRVPAFDHGLGGALLYARVVIDSVRAGSIPIEVLPRIVATVRLTEPGTKLRPLLAQFAAELLAWAGDHAGALEMVRDSVDTGLVDRTWMSSCPLLARVRELEGFPELAKVVEQRAAQVIRALNLV